MPEPRLHHHRGAAVRDGVLDACLAILSERGYDFAVEEVAERAGVHKTTIYRRWPSKAQLVAATMDRFAAVAVPVERSADPVADLSTLAVAVARSLRLGP
ncbi:MAG TPA: helix-turn-helix domain-containing protein, partial [Acidimicrobiales bacterium]|nr:helix-turn-helix domain-containing protein [Acidimicrobiales bacterium]